MENLVISYGLKVGFRNNRNGRYFINEPSTTKFSTNGNHPFIKLKNNGETVQSNEEFMIVNQQDQNYNGPIIFGSSICIVIDGSFLMSNSTGVLRLEKPKFDDNLPAFLKNAKWTVLDANNITSRRQVCTYDDVIIKSPYGTFLINETDNTVTSSGPNISADSSWKIFKAAVPYIPDWTVLRPFISENFLIPGLEHVLNEKNVVSSSNLKQLGEDKKNLGNMSPLVQELQLIEDILFVMMSIEGVYIKRRPDPMDAGHHIYAIEPYLDNSNCDSSIRQLVGKILPICTYHDRLEVFINIHSQFEYGLVSQALCAALKNLIREYILLTNQLDNEMLKGELNLQKLWFYIQPSLHVMESLVKLATTAEKEKAKGGALLSIIHKLMKSSTDVQTQQVYAFLLNKSFVPYCDMLNQWIYHGTIDDVYEEFLIKERKDIVKENINKEFKDNYWEKRFVLRPDQVPSFLNKLGEQILMTGKYLNVIRECDRKINCPYNDELLKNYELYISSQDLSDPIQKAYDWANSQLIHLVLVEEQLMNRLRSIKHYFFLDTGDFFVHFVDSAEDELNKPMKSVSKEKLESLLEMSLRTSSANADVFKDDLTCDLYPYTLMEQLFAMQSVNGVSENTSANANPTEKFNIFTPFQNIKGIEGFTLDYKVKWPLNLIISRKSLTKYQILFRHLFYCKYIERQLCNTWLLHQTTKELSLQRSMTYSYCLTQRMIHFSKNLVYNMAFEVLEQKWLKFEANMKNVTKFDDILNWHNTYLEECLKESLLLDQNIVKTLSKINNSCLIYSKSIQNFTQNMKVNEQISIDKDNMFDEKKKGENSLEKRKLKIQMDSQATKKIIKEQSYLRTIQKFAKSFDGNLKDFIFQVNQQYTKFDSHLNNLLSRLDYDGFYSNYLFNANTTGQNNLSNLSIMSKNQGGNYSESM
jgi:gamma-tubulin complex component 2